MPPTQASIERLARALRLESPILGLYDSADLDAYSPVVVAKGHACCFAYYARWTRGTTVAFRKGLGGCGGAHRALGLEAVYPDFMANFLTDGVGAPKGEGLKASPELAQAFLDRARPPDVKSGTVLLGPPRVDRWSELRSVTFFVDPDRLAAVMTLAGFWSAEAAVVTAPFSSGCGLLWRELDAAGEDRPVLGATDVAMRRYLPPDILALSVSPARFEQMLAFPDDSFLFREWWTTLMDRRERQRARASGTFAARSW